MLYHEHEKQKGNLTFTLLEQPGDFSHRFDQAQQELHQYRASTIEQDRHGSSNLKIETL